MPDAADDDAFGPLPRFVGAESFVGSGDTQRSGHTLRFTGGNGVLVMAASAALFIAAPSADNRFAASSDADGGAVIAPGVCCATVVDGRL